MQISAATSNDPRQDLTKVFSFATDLDTAKRTANVEGKPVMVIVHATYCSACKKLLPDLVANKDVKELSKKFVVIHSVDGSDPQAENFTPAHSYYPRFEKHKLILHLLQ